MTLIYALKAGELVLYVGRTTRPLSERARGHRSVGNDATSKYIPDWIDWEMVLLEECADDMGIVREQYYYDSLKPWYNRCRPGQTDREFRQTEEQKLRIATYEQTEARKIKKRAADKRYRARKKAQALSP